MTIGRWWPVGEAQGRAGVTTLTPDPCCSSGMSGLILGIAAAPRGVGFALKERVVHNPWRRGGHKTGFRCVTEAPSLAGGGELGVRSGPHGRVRARGNALD